MRISDLSSDVCSSDLPSELTVPRQIVARHQRRLRDQQREPRQHRHPVDMHPKGRRDRIDEAPQRELQKTEDDEDREADRHPVPEKLSARGAPCTCSPAHPPCPHPRENSVAATGRKTRFYPVDALAKRRSEEHTSELQSLMRISYAV